MQYWNRPKIQILLLARKAETTFPKLEDSVSLTSYSTYLPRKWLYLFPLNWYSYAYICRESPKFIDRFPIAVVSFNKDYK